MLGSDFIGAFYRGKLHNRENKQALGQYRRKKRTQDKKTI